MGLIKQISGAFIPRRGSLPTAAKDLLSLGAESARAALDPDNYELFEITLQLSYDDSSAIEILTFPVMPESLAMAQRYLMTVTPTLGGNFVDDFGRAPSPINISGTFGRKSRPVMGNHVINKPSDILRSLGSGGMATGYGMMKKLSDFVENSHKPNNNSKLPIITLYNWAFDSHWEVVINGLDITMSTQVNNLWFYNLQMTALRPANKPSQLDRFINSAIRSFLGSDVGRNVRNGIAAVRAVQTARSVLSDIRRIRL